MPARRHAGLTSVGPTFSFDPPFLSTYCQALRCASPHASATAAGARGSAALGHACCLPRLCCATTLPRKGARGSSRVRVRVRVSPNPNPNPNPNPDDRLVHPPHRTHRPRGALGTRHHILHRGGRRAAARHRQRHEGLGLRGSVLKAPSWQRHSILHPGLLVLALQAPGCATPLWASRRAVQARWEGRSY